MTYNSDTVQHKKALIIGETNLCTQCAQYLLDRDWKITLASDDPTVISWATTNSMPLLPVSQLATFQEENFYLFSIINHQLIPESFLANKNILLALNYHDSPLPRYAGINSTTWAILNNEKTHGVTLHQITSGIDTGDIVAQSTINIDPNETAISLNLKCSEQLLILFKQVVTQIENNAITLTKQDLSQRTYYGSKYIPTNYGIINGIKDPVTLNRLLRSLTFGEGYVNQVATAKLCLNNQFYIVEDFNQDDLIFNTIKDIYGNNADTTIVQAIQERRKLDYHISEQHELTTADFTYLSNIKAQERKNKNYFLELLSSGVTTLLGNASNIKKYTKELRLPNYAITKILASVYLVLARFFYDNDFLVSLYTSNASIPATLRNLIENRTFIRVNTNFLNNGFSHLEDHLYQLLQSPRTVTKDFYYRYGLRSQTDIAITIGEVEGTDKYKIIIKIENNRLIIEGISAYQLQIDSITESIGFLFSKNIQKDIVTHDLQRISILNDVRHQQIVYEFNKTDKDYPRDKTIHKLFEEQVLKTPNKIAVVYENIKLTYQDLNSKANQLANYLLQIYAIKPDELISLCLDRNEKMLVAILGVLKAGGAYVPLSPSYPNDRIKYVLNNIKTKVVLTNSEHVNKIKQIVEQTVEKKNISILTIDDIETQRNLSDQKSTNPITQTTSTNLVYVIYTSGTTGNPKGVMIEHRSLVNFASYATKFITTEDIITSYIDYSFDAINAEIYPVLLSGNPLHILSDYAKSDLSYLYEYIIKNNITFITLPSAIATEFSLYYDLSSTKLRVMIVGGDVYRGKLETIKVINQYGPTESTVCATLHCYNVKDSHKNIGKPINNVKCYIVDSNLNILPIGAVGELVIGGENLARGYLNLPDLTAKKFITNPFQTSEEELHNKNSRFYKTGDLARLLPDGNIEYIGRNDSQVKIRGYRIELGEIESKLLVYQNIKQAVVLVKENITEQTTNKYLVAYYVSDQKLDDINLIAHLSNQLPEYMIPQVFIHLSNLPLTTNGKLDKKVLLEHEYETEFKNIPPVTELEKNLCVIYAQALNVPVNKIGIDSDFFRMGGSSITVISLTHKINSQLKVNINVKDIFNCKNIKQLVEKCFKSQRSKNHSKNIAIKKYQHLAPLIKSNDILPLNSVAFCTMYDLIADHEGVPCDYFISEIMQNKPFLYTIINTVFGRIGIILLPIKNEHIYMGNSILTEIDRGMDLAQECGARCVSLTGLIPSATNYGRDVKQNYKCNITTGHGNTVSAVVLNIAHALKSTKRNIETESVTIVGLGSIGLTSLNLMLTVLKHPRQLILCDLFSKTAELERIKSNIINNFHYTGDISIATDNSGNLPNSIYNDATLIIGATSVPDIVDTNLIRPGTIIIDDSAPHIFHFTSCLERFKKQKDILVLQAGKLTLPDKTEYIYANSESHVFGDSSMREVMGCTLGSILPLVSTEIPCTLGLVDLPTVVSYYKFCCNNKISASSLQCADYYYSKKDISDFLRTYDDRKSKNICRD